MKSRLAHLPATHLSQQGLQEALRRLTRGISELPPGRWAIALTNWLRQPGLFSSRFTCHDFSFYVEMETNPYFIILPSFLNTISETILRFFFSPRHGVEMCRVEGSGIRPRITEQKSLQRLADGWIWVWLKDEFI